MLRSRAAQALLLALFSAAPYFEVTGHDFVNLDDLIYVHDHPSVRAALSCASVARTFLEPHEGNWIPLTSLSLQLGRVMHGPWAPGFLVTNVGLHAASAAVLFLALARMTGAVGPSAFVAAVFGVHPLHVESVAWVAERKDVLSGLFFALALLAYARRVEEPTRARSALVAVWMALGLLAKPMLVTLPFVLLLLDHWPLGRLREPGGSARPAPRRVARAVTEKVPLFALSAIASWIAWRAQRAHGSMGFGATLDLSARLANALVAVAVYAGKAVWPTGLAAYYPYPEAFPAAELALSGGLVALATALALAWARSRPYLLVGWLWYVGMLVPVLGIVQVGMQARADRYTYLPLVGLAVALAWGARDLAGARRRALAAAAAGALCALALATAAQVRHWRDTQTLFERALAVTRDNYIAHDFLANTLLAERRLDEAERHYREALRLRPQWLEPRLGLADVELARGRASEALAVYEAVLRERPGDPDASARLGLARVRLGAFAEARAPLELALAAHPHAPTLHLALALVEAAAGDPASALRREREALALDPEDVAAANNLAWRLATVSRPELRDPAEALRLASSVVERRGRSDPGVLDTLAAAQAAGGDFASALRNAEEALRIARERGDTALADEIAARRARYAAGGAWVEGRTDPAH